MILFTGDRRLNKLEEDVNKLLDSTSGLAVQKNNITELKTKVTGLSNDVNSTKNSIVDLQNKVKSVEECTTLMAGVHSCRVPKYEVNTAPKDLTVKDMISPEKNFCIKIEELADINQDMFHRERLRKEVGTGDVADNYICLDKEIVKQNATALLPEAALQYFSDHSDMTLKDSARRHPQCNGVCKTNTCSQVDTMITESRQPGGQTNADSRQAIRDYPIHTTSKDLCAMCPASDFKCAPYVK